jgi:DNA replicative helicase MCM subunit Mcm2 (Cdc46/Mcm family)
MSSPSFFEIATAIAAVVSAVGGAFAAVAAFRSADSAREAARSAEDSNRRAMLRELSSTAASILVAVLGIKSRATELIVEYKSAEIFSGSTGHSSLQKLKENTLELQATAESFVADASLFANGATQLAKSPVEEIDRIWVRLSGNLQVLQTIRDELDRKYTAMATQNLQHREIALQSRS